MSYEGNALDLNVIVADDEEGIRELLSLLLEAHGLNVSVAENGRDAYQLYTENPNDYDLIISDMRMPVMDGPTFLKTLRGNAGIKQPKFVFMTGDIHINFEDEKSGLGKLIDGHIFKPFSEEAIFETIAEIFERRPKSEINS